MHRFGVVFLGVAMALGGCVRDAQPEICPQLRAGDLVVTEIRGAAGSYGQWIELYNNSDTELDLRGVNVRMDKLNGDNAATIRVRASELLVAPGAYVVLGHQPPDMLPDYVDYSFFADYFIPASTSSDETGDEPLVSTADDAQPKDLPDGGTLEVSACGVMIDTLVYRALPADGSWSLDGNEVPNADTNDDESRWCNDEHLPTAPQTGIGLPGTPQEANEPCL